MVLYRKGKQHEPGKYPPKSPLNCFSKIFEKLIYKQLIKFIEKHKILYKHQFGFRQEYSTTLALIDIVDNIKSILDNNEYALGIFLDIRKAFDSINHVILLQKLEHYGFRGHANKFLESYLTNRQQFSVINSTVSETRHISYGVPQGSVLGPLLFLIYINDLQHVVTQAKARLFADDTSLLIRDKDINVLINTAESVIKQIQKWFQLNRLALSIEKSNFIIFHNKGKRNISHIQHINIENEQITRVKHTKYVGLIIDEHLTWDAHINDICNSLTRYFGVFYNIRHFINPHLARCIYYACIYSKVKYGIEIYGCASQKRMNKLQTLQNKLLKLLTKKHRRYGTDHLHTDLDILKVHDIYKTSVLSFVHNCMFGNPIEVFQDYFQSRQTIHTHHTRSRHNLITHRARTELGKSSTHYVGATLWNQLNNEICSIKNKHTFRKDVSKFFKSQYL